MVYFLPLSQITQSGRSQRQILATFKEPQGESHLVRKDAPCQQPCEGAVLEQLGQAQLSVEMTAPAAHVTITSGAPHLNHLVQRLPISDAEE